MANGKHLVGHICESHGVPKQRVPKKQALVGLNSWQLIEQVLLHNHEETWKNTHGAKENTHGKKQHRLGAMT